MPLSQEEKAAEDFKVTLNELNSINKVTIDGLTMLADEHKEFAIQIATCIENQLKTVPNKIKLPVLYLIDSICKNYPKSSYVQLFTQNIVSNFCHVFENSDEKVRRSLHKLRMTWHTTKIFPQKKLNAIDERVHEMDPNWPVVHKIPATVPKQQTQAQTNIVNNTIKQPHQQQQAQPSLVQSYPQQNQPQAQILTNGNNQDSQLNTNTGDKRARPNRGNRKRARLAQTNANNNNTNIISNNSPSIVIPSNEQSTLLLPHPQPFVDPNIIQTAPLPIAFLDPSITNLTPLPPPITQASQLHHSQAQPLPISVVPQPLQQQPQQAPPPPQPPQEPHLAILESLYGGKQCSNCSLRFDDNNRYASHLDWHFRQNLKSENVFARRKWYYPLTLWVQFREINDDENQEVNNTDSQNDQLLLSVNDFEVPTAPASKDDERNICSVCHETFEKFWAEEEEEWRLKNAKLYEDERVYHPLCLKDMLQSSYSMNQPVETCG